MMAILTSASVVDSSQMHGQFTVFVGRPRRAATARQPKHTSVSGVLPAASTHCAYRHLQRKLPDADGTHKSLRINNAVAA